jgi:hypothetical protein
MPTLISHGQDGYVTLRSPSVTFPVTALSGDTVVFWCTATVGAAATITDPAGWVNVLGANGRLTHAHTMCCLYHVVTPGEEGNDTFTATNLWDAGRSGVVLAALVRSVSATTPIDAVSTATVTSNVNPHVLPGLEGDDLATSSLVFSGISADQAFISYTTQPSGWTFREQTTENTPAALLSRDTTTNAGVDIPPTNIEAGVPGVYHSITVAFLHVTAGVPHTVNPADGIGVSDTAVRSWARRLAVVDGVTIDDTGDVVSTGDISVVENVTLDDTAQLTKGGPGFVVIGDHVGLTDEADVSLLIPLPECEMPGVILPGVVGNHLSVADGPEFTIANDLDVRWYGWLVDWASGSQALLSQFDAFADLRSWLLRVEDNVVRFYMSTDGVNQFVTPADAAWTSPFWGSDFGGLRVTRRRSDGLVTMWVDRRGSWEQWATATLQSGAALFDTSTAVNIGAFTLGQQSPMTGQVHTAEVWRGPPLERVFAFGPASFVGVDPSADDFVAFTGQTVNVHRLGINPTRLCVAVAHPAPCPQLVPVAAGPGDRDPLFEPCPPGEEC